MIWIISGYRSYQIFACNAMDKSDGHDNFGELWVTLANDKGLKVLEGTIQEVDEHKRAIDYAVDQGRRTFRLA